MNHKVESSFPAVDPAGITPGHDESPMNPPEPQIDSRNATPGGTAGSKKPRDGDTSQESGPDTDLVSIGTNPSNPAV